MINHEEMPLHRT